MEKIRLAQMGGGIGAFIGDAHRRGARISNRYELVAGVFDVNFERAKEFAQKEGIDSNRTYADIDEFIKGELQLSESERIEAVSIVTPNFLHYEMAKKCLENGFHVICEKPMTMTVEEAETLQKIVDETGLTFALLHTYTGYPLVRQMREMIRGGEIGEIQRVDAQYYQGWINPIVHNGEVEKVWRLNSNVTGVSSCMGDIGVHAFNLIEYTTGLETTKVLSDLNKIGNSVELDLDGTVLLRFNAETKGVIRSSQVATGEENNLTIAIYGSKLGLKWSQEDPNYLFVLSDNKPVERLKPGNPYLKELGIISHTMPPGHPEGIYEAIANIYTGAAKSIKGEEYFDGEFPTVLDGVRGMKFIHNVVESNAKGNVWISL
ncbi:MAG: Gfo/Idh/MocA family oxidoreductase [Melioribacteraceae bacterium]|nr:Gfo/Idh/MocA family oxidoreductase [Melioribacteraceae bacterium]MCF8266045.1 Gfo/Idh/MocA family oxidoreductase [Melioribacteraceae bacterium]